MARAVEEILADVLDILAEMKANQDEMRRVGDACCFPLGQRARIRSCSPRGGQAALNRQRVEPCLPSAYRDVTDPEAIHVLRLSFIHIVLICLN